jgi:hypothetical protein
MKNTRKGFLILSFALIHCLALSQLPDGAIATQSFLDTIIVNYADENSVTFNLTSSDPSVNIPISVHIIMNRKGSPGLDLKDIKYSVALANGYFKNAGIRYFIDTVEYINDYNYSFITNNKLRKELLTKHAINNRVNLFLADSIKMGTGECYGFTYFPDEPDSNFIYLDKEYAAGNSLTTMLGHYMGLLSTHESAGGRELASEKNCSSSGDYICDTYADPGLFNEVIDSCKYIGRMRDDSGRYFIPSVANIMSDAPDRCKCILTPLQYRRIYYYYHMYRQYLTN